VAAAAFGGKVPGWQSNLLDSIEAAVNESARGGSDAQKSKKDTLFKKPDTTSILSL